MAILKNPNKDKFTVIDNFALRDNRLSLKARGLLVTMLSLPDNWKFSENGLCSIFEKDGQAAIRSGLKELEEAGYLVRERVRDEHGRVSSVNWIVYDKPQVENPSVETPNLEEQPQLNTKELNTDSKEELKDIPHNPQTGDMKKAKKKSRAENKQDVQDVLHAYTQDEDVLDQLDAWLEVRKEKRSPNTVRAVKINLKKLDNMARLSKMSVPQYLDEIVARGWAAFYVINSFPQNNTNYKNNTNCNNSQKINDAPVTEHDIYGD